jgi:hypothetical protein
VSDEGVRIAEPPSQLECVPSGPVVRLPYYGSKEDPKIRFGERCFVDDPYWREFQGVSMRFVAVAHNLESGITWVELNGGPQGKVWTRAFPATSVRVPTKKRP